MKIPQKKQGNSLDKLNISNGNANIINVFTSNGLIPFSF